MGWSRVPSAVMTQIVSLAEFPRTRGHGMRSMPAKFRYTFQIQPIHFSPALPEMYKKPRKLSIHFTISIHFTFLASRHHEPTN